MSDNHDHDGPCISVEPVRAFEISVGDMLAAPGGGMPRVCLVTFTERQNEDTENDTVTLNVLDARIWETNEGELNEACLQFDALNIVGRVVLHEH